MYNAFSGELDISQQRKQVDAARWVLFVSSCCLHMCDARLLSHICKPLPVWQKASCVPHQTHIGLHCTVMLCRERAIQEAQIAAALEAEAARTAAEAEHAAEVAELQSELNRLCSSSQRNYRQDEQEV